MQTKATTASPHSRQTSPIAFFRGFLRNPDQVGSIIPSSRFLEKRIIEATMQDTPRIVVELGPGTGGTTRALLDALPADGRLLAIELDPHFVGVLSDIGDPRLTVHHGSAADVCHLLQDYGLGTADAVVSGIPFSSMPEKLGRQIMAAVWDCLSPQGCFVAYQFRSRVITLGKELLGTPVVEMEYLNVPPMRVCRWSKTNTGSKTVSAS